MKMISSFRKACVYLTLNIGEPALPLLLLDDLNMVLRMGDGERD